MGTGYRRACGRLRPLQAAAMDTAFRGAGAATRMTAPLGALGTGACAPRNRGLGA